MTDRASVVIENLPREQAEQVREVVVRAGIKRDAVKIRGTAEVDQ